GSLGISGPEVQQITILGASGTFRLTFKGQTTTPLDINSPTLTVDIQNALNVLTSIANAGGFVTVTRSGPVYTVTFGRDLAGANQPQLISTVSPGVTARVSTVQDGPESTTVNSGGTLQVQNNLTISTEPLFLNGLGFNNA